MNHPIYAICRKLGTVYEHPSDSETTEEQAKRMKRINKRIKSQEHKLKTTRSGIPHAPPPTGDKILDNALDHMRAFELKQILYICPECRINMKMHNNKTCLRCYLNRDMVKMFSEENNMDPKPLPCQILDLSIVEQQLICIANFHGHTISALSLINESMKKSMSTVKVREFPEFGELQLCVIANR